MYENKAGTNAAAAKGTLLHEISETGMRAGRNLRDVADEEFEKDTIDDYDVELLGRIQDLVDRVREEDYAKVFLYEERIQLTELGIDGLDFGTVDFVVIDHPQFPKRGAVADWKFGIWEVTGAESNRQLWLYAIGLFLRYPTLEQLDIHMVMPRHLMVSSATLSRSRVENELIPHVIKVGKQIGNGTERVVLSNCMFCARKIECNAFLSIAEKVATRAEDLGEEFDLPEVFDPYDPDHAGAVYDLLGQLENWCKDVKREISGRAFDGELEVKGKDVRWSNGRAEILSSINAINLLVEGDPEKGVDPIACLSKDPETQIIAHNELSSKLTISIGAIEEIINEFAPRGQKDASKKLARKLLADDGNMITGSGYPFLVDAPESRGEKPKQVNTRTPKGTKTPKQKPKTN